MLAPRAARPLTAEPGNAVSRHRGMALPRSARKVAHCRERGGSAGVYHTPAAKWGLDRPPPIVPERPARSFARLTALIRAFFESRDENPHDGTPV